MALTAGSLTYDTKLDTSGFKTGLSKIENFASTTAKTLGVAVGVVATGLTAIVTSGINQYAEYEQLIGGVESMFGGVEKGLEQINKVQETAKNAWKDLTMSQNEYYNSFNSTYPLIKSSIEDQNEAIDTTNRMLTLESDLANTFGYDMENAATAINWALKGTYSYLDNLNIGIKGTKEGFLEAAKNAGYVVDDVSELGSKEILDILEKTANQFGVLGRTQLEASKTIQGSIKSLKASWNDFLTGEGGVENVVSSMQNVLSNIIPVIVELAPKLTEGIEQLIEQLIPEIPVLLEELIPIVINSAINIINIILEQAPKLLEVAKELIMTLATGLTNSLPILIPSAVETILTLIDTLLDNIDLVIDTAIQIIIALAEGIINALPVLIEKAPIILEKFVIAIQKNLPKIVKAGGEILGQLVVGIIGALWKLAEVAPQLIATIVNGLKGGISSIKNIGKDFVEGLWNGINERVGWLKEKISSFATNIVGNMKSALGIHSPSKVMKDMVGKFIPEGIAEGIKENSDIVYDTIANLGDTMVDKVRNAVNVETGKMSFNGVSGSVSQIISANAQFEGTIPINLNLDGETIFNNQQKIKSRKNLQYGGVY